MKRKAEVSFGSGHKWTRGKKIGQGGFGSVFVAFSKIPYIKINKMPTAMAMKSAKIKDCASIQYELDVFTELNSDGGSCPFIIEHYGEEMTRSDDGEEIYNLALEIGWGSLRRLIKILGHGLREFDVRRYTRDILEGVRYMHKRGYVHCDLKPDNILLVETGDGLVAKLGDLGLAKKTEVQDRWRGTPMYLAPETVLYNEQEEASDIWSVGCVVLELLTGECPRSHFYEKQSDVLYIVDGIQPKIPDTISSLAREFLGFCLAEEVVDRWTAEELLSHPFVADVR